LHEVSKKIQISSSGGSYVVNLGSKFNPLDFRQNHVFIADDFFRELLSEVKSNCIFVEASERKKTLESVNEILTKLHGLGVQKGTHIVALGGGIIQDLATLASSLYMRGLKWTYVPTTKMAQLDSCIGGKSSINLGGVKNIVGNIYPPSEVLIDESFEKTLTPEAISSGYLEAIKISYASGASGFGEHLEMTKEYNNVSKLPYLPLCELVLSQKKRFVEEDEFDSGIRQLLNFGHTFAHAIESATHYRIQHGLAVGVGMMMAMNHPDSVIMENEILLKKAILNLLQFAGREAYADLSKVEEKTFIGSFRNDKKHSLATYNLILPVLGGLEKKAYNRNSEVEKVLVEILHSTSKELVDELW